MKENTQMKGTGVVRKVDSLGRVVIPMEVRRVLGMEVETPLEFFVDGEGNIILKKYIKSCSICGDKSVDNVLQPYRAALLCEECYSFVKGKE